MDNLESLFLDFCAQKPQGATDKEFRSAYPKASPSNLVQTINVLSSKGLLELHRSGATVFYKAVKTDEAAILATLEGDEKVVYQCIKVADNKGIWTKDLKNKTNLHQTIITKALKTLESKRLIKAVKSVKNSTRKVYMLTHLEPSVDITGGPWFSENELDTEFIEELCTVCYRYILSKSFPSKPGYVYPADYAGYPSLDQIYKFISESRITSAELGLADIALLVDRLIYDGLVERTVYAGPRVSMIVSDDEEDVDLYVFKAIRNDPPTISILGTIPCGLCPVFELCSDRDPVTPSNCAYYDEWLG